MVKSKKHFISKVFTTLILCTLYLCSCVSVKTKNLTYKDSYILGSSIIKTDGYYYKMDDKYNIISIFIFFKNGYLFQGDYTSREEIGNLFFRKDLNESKYSWGVYKIDSNIIKVQFFTASRGNELNGIWDVIEEHGKILNDSTIVFYKSFLNKKEYDFSDEYKFYEMNTVPNSSNWLMKVN